MWTAADWAQTGFSPSLHKLNSTWKSLSKSVDSTWNDLESTPFCTEHQGDSKNLISPDAGAVAWWGTVGWSRVRNRWGWGQQWQLKTNMVGRWPLANSTGFIFFLLSVSFVNFMYYTTVVQCVCWYMCQLWEHHAQNFIFIYKSCSLAKPSHEWQLWPGLFEEAKAASGQAKARAFRPSQAGTPLSTTNESMQKGFYWMFYTYHCTTFGIRPGISPNVASPMLATSITLPNSMLTPFCRSAQYNKWIIAEQGFYQMFHTHCCTTLSIRTLLMQPRPHQPHLIHCWIVCQPLFVGLHSTTNNCNRNDVFTESIRMGKVKATHLE